MKTTMRKTTHQTKAVSTLKKGGSYAVKPQTGKLNACAMLRAVSKTSAKTAAEIKASTLKGGFLGFRTRLF